MGRLCSAYGCTNRAVNGTHLQFHRFPVDRPATLNLWLNAVNRENFTPTASSVLCSDHFVAENYQSWSGKSRKLLRHDAVPSIFRHSQPETEKILPLSLEEKSVQCNLYKLPSREKSVQCTPKRSTREKSTHYVYKPVVKEKSEQCNLKTAETLRLQRECKIVKQRLKRQDVKIKSLKDQLRNFQKQEQSGGFTLSDNEEEATNVSSDSPTFPESNVDTNSSVGNIEGAFKTTTNDEALHLITEDIANFTKITLSLENVDTVPPLVYFSEIEYTEEAKLLLEKCRLCFLNPGEYRISSEEGLAEKISDYIKIKLVETPNHPQSICTCCKTFLDAVHNFAAEVHAANRKLESILGKTAASPQSEKFKQPVKEGDSMTELNKDQDSPTGRFKCELCGERFFLFIQYRQHKKTHVVLYVCDEIGCGRKFSMESYFKKHLYNHTRQKELALKHKKYTCRLCKESFMNETLLKEHEGTHLNFECPVNDCTTILQNWKSFVSHMLLHNNIRRYLCQVCGKSFRTDSQFNQHEKIHKGVRYKCDVCDMSYVFKNTLRKHIQVKHEGVRFYCSKCPKSYTSIRAVNYHEKMHSGERAFQCNLCPKSFTYKRNLKTHILRHQGIKQYQCKVCSKSFVMKCTLRLHEKIHVGEKFLCSVEGCGKLLTRIDRLRNHMKLAHPEQFNQ